MFRDFFKLNEEEKEFVDSIKDTSKDFWADIKPIRRIILFPFVLLGLSLCCIITILIFVSQTTPS